MSKTAPSHSEQQPQLSYHPLPPRALCHIPVSITRAPKLCQCHDSSGLLPALTLPAPECPSLQHPAASLIHGITERKTRRSPQPFTCGHLGRMEGLPVAGMPRCWHCPQPGRLADYKGECVISNTQSDFPALLPITKCLVKWLVLFSHRNVFPFKSLIRGEEGGGKKEKAKLKISPERYHDSNRFTGK